MAEPGRTSTGADIRARIESAELGRRYLRNANSTVRILRVGKLPGATSREAHLRKATCAMRLTEAILPGRDLSEAQASGIEIFPLRLVECKILGSANFAMEHARRQTERREINGRRDSGRGHLRENGLEWAPIFQASHLATT